MKHIELGLPGVLLIEGNRHSDSRGSFMELFNGEKQKILGVTSFNQDNISYSKEGVIRGMHWQAPPYEQGKLVTCILGSILDVILVIDKNKSNYGEFIAVELNAESGKSIWIPRGYAHGFEALSDNVIVHYKTDSPRKLEAERRINPLSEVLRDVWHAKRPTISDADLAGKYL